MDVRPAAIGLGAASCIQHPVAIAPPIRQEFKFKGILPRSAVCGIRATLERREKHSKSVGRVEFHKAIFPKESSVDSTQNTA
jgi:hypothetical protein